VNTTSHINSTAKKVVVLPINSLRPAPYNPSGRIRLPVLKPLMDSIREIGLLYPLLIDNQKQVIDGHRRLEVVKQLGWEEVPTITVHSNQTEQVYASVNTTARKMGGNESLCVWLKCRDAVSARQRVQYAYMEDVLGADRVEKAAEAGYSYRLFDTARRLSRYCDIQTPEFIKEAFDWLVDYATIGQVMKAMEGGEPAKVFVDAIRRKRSVRLRLTVDDIQREDSKT
jgi:hypothetical protein